MCTRSEGTGWLPREGLEEWATPATNTPRGSGEGPLAPESPHSAARDSALGPPPATGVFQDQQVKGDNREAAGREQGGSRVLVSVNSCVQKAEEQPGVPAVAVFLVWVVFILPHSASLCFTMTQ